MERKANIVLVHGAWADGSSWHKVIPLLIKGGHSVTVSQQTLTSLEEDVESIRRLVEAQQGATILVGHSYGGAIITEAARHSLNVVGLVYIAAFAPDTGDNIDTLSKGAEPPSGGAAVRPDAYGRLWLDKEMFAQSFCQDADEADAIVMAAVQKPIAINCFTDKITQAGWRDLPSWYQVSENDRMINPALQHIMAKNIKARNIRSLPSSHASMISHYNEVAEFILDICRHA